MQNPATVQNCVQPTAQTVSPDQICAVINRRTVINLLSASLVVANAGKKQPDDLNLLSGESACAGPSDH